MPPGKILEIACFNLESAMIAEESGADRIELCENYRQGGLTPSPEIILAVRKKIGIPVHVIIRPQSDSFIYSKTEIKGMNESIRFCKANGIDGVVFGVLDKENRVNQAACEELMAAAGTMSVSFHRAIDQCGNINDSIEKLIDLGFDRVLTSGGETEAEKGIERLKELQALYGRKIIIMPGGGLRSGNLEILLSSGCSEYHSSAVKGNSEIADRREIEKIKQVLNRGF